MNCIKLIHTAINFITHFVTCVMEIEKLFYKKNILNLKFLQIYFLINKKKLRI